PSNEDALMVPILLTFPRAKIAFARSTGLQPVAGHINTAVRLSPRDLMRWRWRRWSVAVQRDAGGVGARAKGKARRKRRLRPPWGGLLGGKPIERQAWYFNDKLDLGD